MENVPKRPRPRWSRLLRREKASHLIEARRPSVVLAVAPLRLGDAAVDEQDPRRALPLGELELDQLLVRRVVVEGPGECKEPRPLDHGVLALGPDRLPVRCAHDDPDSPADAEVHLGVRFAPALPWSEPA